MTNGPLQLLLKQLKFSFSETINHLITLNPHSPCVCPLARIRTSVTTCCRPSNFFVSINFHKNRSNLSCSLVKDETSSPLWCTTVFKNVCHFSLVSCSSRNVSVGHSFPHFKSILSKRTSQASGDSVMYMGERHMRKRAINAIMEFSLSYTCTQLLEKYKHPL